MVRDVGKSKSTVYKTPIGNMSALGGKAMQHISISHALYSKGLNDVPAAKVSVCGDPADEAAAQINRPDTTTVARTARIFFMVIVQESKARMSLEVKAPHRRSLREGVPATCRPWKSTDWDWGSLGLLLIVSVRCIFPKLHSL